MFSSELKSNALHVATVDFSEIQTHDSLPCAKYSYLKATAAP